MTDLATRHSKNPLITPIDISPSQPALEIVCVMNPGAFSYKGKIWLLVRVAERPLQEAGKISLCILGDRGEIKIIQYQRDDPEVDLSDPRYITYKDHLYLSTLSHLVLLCSNDGFHFSETHEYPSRFFGQGKLESYGIEDCRISIIDDIFYLTYTQVSPDGVGVGLMTTEDWKSMGRSGMVFLPANKDCAIFYEKIGQKYYCLSRPSSVVLGGNYIWISSSLDLKHWGGHHCLLKTRPGCWDSERVGAGAAPIKTKQGWLVIYHGANQAHRYCLGALLLQLDDPTQIISRSKDPIMEPIADYEKEGFFGNVIFTNGHIIDGDQITMYYGASDSVICMATLSIQAILNTL